MAIIYSYPEKTTPAGGDFLVITDSEQPAPKKNRTKSLKVSDLGDYIINSNSVITGGGTLNTIAMFTPDGQKIGDSIITQSTVASNITISGNAAFTSGIQVANETQTNELLVSNQAEFNGECTFDDNMFINGALHDETSSAGLAGQVLSSTSQGVAWIAGDTNTTYDLTGAPSGASDYKVVLTGSDGTVDNVFFEAGDGIELLDQGGAVQIKATNSGTVTGTGTTNTLPIWSNGPNGVLGDSQIVQTKIDGGTVFDLNAVTTTAYTPAINTKLLYLNSGSSQKFSITQDGGGGVTLPSGDILNPGPSFNMGGTAFANGENALAVGAATTAFGNGSFAANFLTLASGGGASAFGLLTEATALASASFGNKTKASGPYSISSGQDTVASGQSALCIGEKGDAQGKNTFVSGFGGTAIANNAVKFGFESTASGANSFAIGSVTTASGFQSISTGESNAVSGDNSFVGGKNSNVTGSESISYGLSNNISANTCSILGYFNSIPSGGFQSFVVGNNNNAGAQGQQKLIGTYLEGASQYGVYLGIYNDNTDSFNKFQIGNGSSGNRSNALSINAAGNVKIPTYGSGTVTGTAAYNLSVAADGKIIETANASTPDYLSFVCLLSQSSGNPQPNIVLENSLGISLPFQAFTRVSQGEYNLNAPGKFKLLKTIVFLNGGSAENNHDVAWEVIDVNNLRIRTHNSDGKLTKASLEVRTYN